MTPWMLLDVKKLIDSLDEDTTSANVGAYEVPLGPLQRKAPKPKKDFQIALGEYEKLFGKAKR